MSKNSQFEKFINKTRGSAIKEQFKQEKKIAKKERAAAIEKRFEEKNCPFFTITDYESLLTEALKQEVILPEQLSTLRNWREQPDKWEGAT